MRPVSEVSVLVGSKVISADGKELGTVKDSRFDRFRVDVRWGPDFWLGTETVDSASEDIVQLFITKNALGAAKLHELDKVAGPGLN